MTYPTLKELHTNLGRDFYIMDADNDLLLIFMYEGKLKGYWIKVRGKRDIFNPTAGWRISEFDRLEEGDRILSPEEVTLELL